MEPPKSVDEVIMFIKEIIAKEMKIPASTVDEHAGFSAFGFDSISSIYLLEQVESAYNIPLSPLYFWDYPSIRLFAEQVFLENFS